MRQWMIGMALITALVAGSVSAEDATPAGKPKAGAGKKPYRVFFIGHSLFFVNSVPEAVQFFSETADVDRPIQITQWTMGGATHQTHWTSPEVQKRLREEDWDLVIIAGNLSDMANPTNVDLEYAVKVDNAAKKRSKRVFEYVAWPWVKVSGDHIFEQRAKAQEAYNQSLLKLARETGVSLMPCGPGLVNAIKKDPALMEEFHYGDIHVSPVGSYLTACVIFSEIYHKSPEGLPGVFQGYNIDKAKAALLQATAWETVQEWDKIQAANLESPHSPVVPH
jgi:hypothetical protein